MQCSLGGTGPGNSRRGIVHPAFSGRQLRKKTGALAGRFPTCRLAPATGSGLEGFAGLKLGVEFQKTLGDLLHTLAGSSGWRRTSQQKMQRLVEERLWPESGLSQAQALHLEIYGWLKGAQERIDFRTYDISISAGVI